MTGSLPETSRPGVYQFVDLDDTVAYVGESGRIRGRLREHIQHFTSSIAGQRRLDYWEIKEIRWWYVPEEADYDGEDAREDAERQLKSASKNRPHLNMEAGEDVDGPIEPNSPDGVVQLLTEDEVQERADPYNRTRRKLTFLSELVDYLQWVDGDDKARAALEHHIGVLEGNLEELASVDSDSHRLDRYNES